MTRSAERCFACGRKLGALKNGERVTTRDGQAPVVGRDCYKRIEKTGRDGYQPPNGGPRLWVYLAGGTAFGPIAKACSLMRRGTL